MMRRLLISACLMAPALLAGPARAQVTLGRLFNTPDERAALDARRASLPQTADNPGGPAALAGQGATPGLPPGAPGAGGSLPAGVPGAGGIALPPGAPGSSVSLPAGALGAGGIALPPGVPGSGVSLPAGAPGAGGVALPPGAPGSSTPALPPGVPGAGGPAPAPAAMAGAPGVNGQMAYPSNGMAPGAADQQAAVEAPPQALTFNGVIRTSNGRSTVWLNNLPQNANQQGLRAGAKGLTVVLPSGRKVILHPGQRYDLATGTVKDVNEQ